MIHLFKHWNRIEELLKTATIPLFLDYDGTLTPIVDHPDRALLSSETKNVLASLVRISGIRLAVVSGRALADIKKRIRVRNMVYVGNHGLEIEGPHFKYTPPLPESYSRHLALLRIKLQRMLKTFPEAELENKRLSLSLHYRRLDPVRVKILLHEARRLVEPCRFAGQVRIHKGKMVLEIRPPGSWNKGKAVEWLLDWWSWMPEGPACIPVFIGDDVTDEDAFEAIGDDGLCIRIGRTRRSIAKYFLTDPREVLQFLKMVLKIKKEGHA
jgi:trehalose-phosphatase